MGLLQLIKERRSIRKYASRPVPRELLEELLEAAIYAPSALDRQNWRFIVLTGKEKLRLMDFLAQTFTERRDQFAQIMSPLHLRLTDEFMNFGKQAPVLLAVYTEMHQEHSYGLIPSVSAAIQNLMLMAHARGLGTCWNTASIYIAEEVSLFLEVPDLQLVGLVTVGYPLESPTPTRRKEGRIQWRGFAEEND